MYYLQMADAHIIGASPEMLVRVEDGVVETHPIAGTMPRGRDPDEDAVIADQLLNDEKERAEHVMLVDLRTERHRPGQRAGHCDR
jgi:anthranilate synthase component 1